MTNGSSKVTQPVIINHPNMDAINRMGQYVIDTRFEENLETLFEFNKSKFEGAFQLDSNTFSETMKLCELIGSGVYHLNYEHDKNKLSMSSSTNAVNKFETSIELEGNIGESATLDFSSPLHVLFDNEMLNFYVKDDFPMLIMSENKLIIKAYQWFCFILLIYFMSSSLRVFGTTPYWLDVIELIQICVLFIHIMYGPKNINSN